MLALPLLPVFLILPLPGFVATPLRPLGHAEVILIESPQSVEVIGSGSHQARPALTGSGRAGPLRPGRGAVRGIVDQVQPPAVEEKDE